MGKFDGILICSDLDGTLLTNKKTISEENKKAIEYFKAEGGIFTFVTGRMPWFVFDMYEEVRPNAPFGCINGCGLYDYAAKKYAWTSTMPEGVFELVRCVDMNFPNVGIQVNTFDKTYFSKENVTMQKFRATTGAKNFVRSYDDIDEGVAKILFGCELEEEIVGIEKMLSMHPLAHNFDLIRSSRTLYEILPNGIGKGTSLRQLIHHLGSNKDKTVAIGDYDNDISMFYEAKIGIAVSNACDAAKKAADYVTVSNEENAIAQVVWDIENGKLKL